MSKCNRSPHRRSIWSVGLALSLACLVMTAASMEYAPVTTGKLLFAVLSLAGTTICAYPLRYRYQRPAASPKPHTVRKHIEMSDRAA